MALTPTRIVAREPNSATLLLKQPGASSKANMKVNGSDFGGHSWAALIRLVYQADPLLCPKCRTQMNIVSVIKDGAVIDKILAHLQYKFQPLPLASVRPPPGTAPEWDFFSAD